MQPDIDRQVLDTQILGKINAAHRVGFRDKFPGQCEHILRLISEKESLNIVGDQWGSPASSSMLGDVTFKIVDTIFKDKNFNDYGTYHVTNDGETNWHDYASLIASELIKLNVKIKCGPNQIHPILTSEYPTPAKRPPNSRLNTDKIKKTFMLELPHWESEVKKVLREII